MILKIGNRAQALDFWNKATRKSSNASPFA